MNGYNQYYTNTIQPFTLNALKECLWRSFEKDEYLVEYYRKWYNDLSSPYAYLVIIQQNGRSSYFNLTGYEVLNDVCDFFYEISRGFLDAEAEAERLKYGPR